jgi:ribosomal protein S12 methylthiotransferase accessory factor
MDMIVKLGPGKKVDVEYKGFTIKTDQPVHGGGEGSAPAPFDYFLASIGSCAGIYALSFCQQRGIPADKVKIIQKHEFNPEKRMIGKIRFEVIVPKEFPDKYKKALISSINLCAVKKHMQDPPEFEAEIIKEKE